jgi:hypothetical protein
MSHSAPPPPPEDPNASAAPPAETPPPPPTPDSPPPPASTGPTYEAPPQAAPAPLGASSMSADDLKRAMQEANTLDIGIIIIGVVTFLLSFFSSYYSASVSLADISVSDNWSAWHGFFGWFAALLVLAAAGLVAAHMMGIKLLEPSMMRLVVLGGFAVALLCTILALFVIPGADCQGFQACEDALDKGHGWSYWISGLFIIAGTVLAFLRKDATD